MNIRSKAVLQFEAWAREEESFRVASVNAEHERLRMGASLEQLRIQQKKLGNDARESADLLGRFHRDCGLLEQEKERLQNQLKDERKILEQCNHDAEDLLDQGKLAKTVYHRSIGSIQMELTEILYQQEEQSLHSMISIETLAALLDTISEQNNETEIKSELIYTMKEWITIATSHENAIAEVHLLAEKVKSLRPLALGILQGKTMDQVTEATMDETERLWEGKIDSEFLYSHPPSSQDDSTVV